LSPSAAGAAFLAVLSTWRPTVSNGVEPTDDQNTHFLAPFAPSVDFAGAFPAVEAGPLEATVEAGFGGIVERV